MGVPVGKTTVERFAEKATKKRIKASGAYASHLYMMQDELRERWPTSLVDCIHQGWEGEGSMPIHHVDAALHTLCEIAEGDIAVFSVPVGRVPFADKCVKQNNDALTDIQADHVQARFWGGTQDEDGCLETTRPVHAQVRRDDVVLATLVRPWAFPLEVGTNSAAKFRFALLQSQGIARWPYGQDRITVFTKRFAGLEDSDFQELQRAAADSIHEFDNWAAWNAEFATQ